MSLKDRAASLLNLKPLIGLYSVAGGLSEFWAFVFGITGIVLAFRGKLDGNFALMITAVQALLVAHDALDNHFQDRKEQRENINVTVNN
jgi:hypothetical protein